VRFQNLSQCFGCPAGRIFFHFVMRFDNLGLKIVAELFGSFARQPEEYIDSDAEIGCKDDRHRSRSLFNDSALLLRVTGRSNDQWLTLFQGTATDFSGGVGLAKINSHIAIFIGGSIESPRSQRAAMSMLGSPFARALIVFPMRPAAPISNTRILEFFIYESLHSVGSGLR